MSDIVEWLQNTAVVRGPDMGGRYREAAAEIKQLRADNETLKAELTECRQERYGYLGKWP